MEYIKTYLNDPHYEVNGVSFDRFDEAMLCAKVGVAMELIRRSGCRVRQSSICYVRTDDFPLTRISGEVCVLDSRFVYDVDILMTETTQPPRPWCMDAVWYWRFVDKADSACHYRYTSRSEFILQSVAASIENVYHGSMTAVKMLEQATQEWLEGEFEHATERLCALSDCGLMAEHDLKGIPRALVESATKAALTGQWAAPSEAVRARGFGAPHVGC